MYFEEQLEHILMKLAIQNKPQPKYCTTEEALLITNHIVDRLKEADAQFSDYFSGVEVNVTYLADLMEQPNEFDVYIKLKLPEPLFIEKLELNNFIRLRSTTEFWLTDAKLIEPFEHGYYANGTDLTRWIYKIWYGDNESIRAPLTLSDDKIYKFYLSDSIRFNHTNHVEVTDQNNQEQRFKLHLLPVIQFGEDKWQSNSKYSVPSAVWYAMPFSNHQNTEGEDFTFMICAPHLENELLKNKKNMLKCMRLLQAFKLLDARSYFKYFIESLILYEIDRQDAEFWEKPLSDLLVHFIQFVYNNNHFDWISRHYSLITSTKREQLYEVIEKLKSLRVKNVYSRELVSCFAFKNT